MVRASQWRNREDMLWCSCLLLLVLSGVATTQESKRTVAVVSRSQTAFTRKAVWLRETTVAVP